MKAIVWKLARHCKVLEVGSYHGASALTWHESGCDVLCVDVWDSYDSGPNMADAYKDFLRNIGGTSIKHMRGNSCHVLHSLDKEQFDIAYIDGDHRYAGAKSDILNAMPLVKDGGIICGDDLNLQYQEMDGHLARAFPEEDFIRDAEGRKFHPGVTCAVWDVFGVVSMWGGFWAMQKCGRQWREVSLAGMPVEYPKHFTAVDIHEASEHLKDIKII